MLVVVACSVLSALAKLDFQLSVPVTANGDRFNTFNESWKIFRLMSNPLGCLWFRLCSSTRNKSLLVVILSQCSHETAKSLVSFEMLSG